MVNDVTQTHRDDDARYIIINAGDRWILDITEDGEETGEVYNFQREAHAEDFMRRDIKLRTRAKVIGRERNDTSRI